MKSDINFFNGASKAWLQWVYSIFFCVNSDGILPSECQFPLLLLGGQLFHQMMIDKYFLEMFSPSLFWLLFCFSIIFPI